MSGRVVDRVVDRVSETHLHLTLFPVPPCPATNITIRRLHQPSIHDYQPASHLVVPLASTISSTFPRREARGPLLWLSAAHWGGPGTVCMRVREDM